MKVKICGIMRAEDGINAISYGADAVGFLVGQIHHSRDFVKKEKAKKIVSQLPPFCSSVLVTHYHNVNDILSLAKYIGVTTIQLHGDSKPDDIKQIKKELPYIKILKSLHVFDQQSIEEGRQFIGFADAIILDTANKKTGQVGGTGITHDWDISRRIVEEYDIPVILAGGLSPDNVEEAIKTVKPFGVDVNSGVRAEDGLKDLAKLKSFIEKAKLMK